MSEQRYAVFDVDGTFFKSSCLEKVIDTAVVEGVFDGTAFAAANRRRRQWQQNNNEGVYQAYLSTLVQGFIGQIVGVEVARFNQVIDHMVDAHRVRLFGFTRRLLEHVAPTHTTVAISGSPQIIVERFLNDLGFDHIVGSQFGQRDGRFTDEITSTNKVADFQRIAGAQGVLDIAVGDTIGDRDIFAMAGRPIAFNPSATLQHVAIENSWPIVTENKDAVYQMLPTGSGSYSVQFNRDPAYVLGEAA